MTSGNFNWLMHVMLVYHTKLVLEKQQKQQNIQNTDSEDEDDESDDEN